MSIFNNKQRVTEVAKEIYETLSVTEHIKELKQAQRELQDQINILDKRLHILEAEIGKIAAETKFEAVKEVQASMNSIQSSLFSKFGELSVEIDRLKTPRLVGKQKL